MAKSITVKKNLIIFHNPKEWTVLWEKLLVTHGLNLCISWVLRRELGFHVRHHRELVTANSTIDPTLKYYQDQIHLDFYNKPAQSWFQLKYLNL